MNARTVKTNSGDHASQARTETHSRCHEKMVRGISLVHHVVTTVKRVEPEPNMPRTCEIISQYRPVDKVSDWYIIVLL